MSDPIRHSRLYSGTLRHRRFSPVENHFSYPIFMLYLDLDELEHVFESFWFASIDRINIASFLSRDFFGYETHSQPESDNPNQPGMVGSRLKQRVIQRVVDDANEQGIQPPAVHAVRLLTHIRYANIIFNPVSFYYCYDSDEQLVAILAEITNTPWGERHSYVLHVGRSTPVTHYGARSARVHAFDFEKQFHVSPFNPMNMDYGWSFSEPGERLRVHMNNFLHGANQDDAKHFDATLVMEQRAIAEFGKTLLRYPSMCVSVVVGIYWQAFKLWIKRSPFYSHPKSLEDASSDVGESTPQAFRPKRGIGS